MKALIVLCHPNTTGFNQAIAHAVADELKKTHEVTFLDLYREPFHPSITPDELPRKFSFDDTVLRYNRLVVEADVLAFFHPDWWGGPPALLKGFIDRIFRPGVAYDFEGTEFLSPSKVGLLAGKKAFVFTTTDYKKPAGPYAPEEIWRYNVLGYCGIKNPGIYTFFDTYGSTYEARHEWIVDAPRKVRAAL